MTKILIGTPCYGGMITEGYMISIINLMSRLREMDIPVAIKTIGNESLITRARNSIVAEFLVHPEKFTHLLFIDADIEFDPNSVVRLLQCKNSGIIAATYPQKNLNWNKIHDTINKGFGDMFKNKNVEEFCLNYSVGEKIGKNKGGNQFQRVKEVPTGFMLLKREILEKMVKKYPELEYTPVTVGYNLERAWDFFRCIIDTGDDGVKRYLSEDYGFCKLWRDIGGEIWVDSKSKLNHIGTYKFRGNFQNSTDFS